MFDSYGHLDFVMMTIIAVPKSEKYFFTVWYDFPLLLIIYAYVQNLEDIRNK